MHLVSGREVRSRPTLMAAVRRSAARRDERIVSLGAALRGAAVTIPMPAGRIGIASGVLSRWAGLQMRPDEVLLAWDTAAVCVASETQQPIAAVLDGLPHPGRITRCAASLIGLASVPLMAGSTATAEKLGGTSPVVGCGGPLPAAKEIYPRHDRQRVRVIFAAEPDGQGQMLPLVGVLCRLHLLGIQIQICIAGTPADAPQMCSMLADIGIEDVVMCGAGNSVSQPGDVVYLPVSSPSIGVVPPVAPAVMAWSSGADIVLPVSHPAIPLLGGVPGVRVMQDTDDVVRWIVGGRDEDVASRVEVADGWRSEMDRTLDDFVAVTAHTGGS